jgi:hypothetical protein
VLIGRSIPPPPVFSSCSILSLVLADYNGVQIERD